MYLWGDGAQYTEGGDSILLFSCGFVLDKNRSNIFPLFLCREDTCLRAILDGHAKDMTVGPAGYKTLFRFFDPASRPMFSSLLPTGEVVKSFDKLYEGVDEIKLVVTECRGDWKFQQDLLCRMCLSGHRRSSDSLLITSA